MLIPNHAVRRDKALWDSYSVGKKIHDDLQIAPAIPYPHIRNISEPYPVWLRYNELTLEQIRQAGMSLTGMVECCLIPENMNSLLVN